MALDVELLHPLQVDTMTPTTTFQGGHQSFYTHNLSLFT